MPGESDQLSEDELLDELLEGDISEADFLRLEAELIVSKEARLAYYERLKLHTGLQEESRTQSGTSESSTTTSLPPRRRLDPILSAALVALAFAVGLLIWKARQDTLAAKPEPLASGFGVVVDLADAVWKDGLTLAGGDLLPETSITLQGGLARIELFNGVVLVVQGESTFTLMTEMELLLESGSVQVLVPEMAQGFRVRTPHGDVVGQTSELAIEVSGGQVTMQVIDGEIEWHPEAAEIQLVSKGASLQWNSDGSSEMGTADAASMSQLEAGFEQERDQRRSAWERRRKKLLRDPQLLAYYAMGETEAGHNRLKNLSGVATSGTVVLADRSTDRWGSSQVALDFSPMGSRVRLNVPGEHESLTLMCWVKIDSLDRLYNSLFLTDGHELHEPHWQIMSDGRLFFSVRAQNSGKGKDKHVAYSPPIWTPAQSGQWIHLTTVYHGKDFTITHYVNGEAVSIDQIPTDLQPEKVSIGAASIGNWSEPRHRIDAEFAVRNLNGSIDEFGMWDKAMTATEVMGLFEAGRL